MLMSYFTPFIIEIMLNSCFSTLHVETMLLSYFTHLPTPPKLINNFTPLTVKSMSMSVNFETHVNELPSPHEKLVK